MTGPVCIDGSGPFKTSTRSMACVHSALASLHMVNDEGKLHNVRAVEGAALLLARSSRDGSPSYG